MEKYEQRESSEKLILQILLLPEITTQENGRTVCSCSVGNIIKCSRWRLWWTA